MIIRRAIAADAKRISYLIRKNAEMVEANAYNKAQKKAWSNQNTPKAIQRNIESITIFCAFQNKKLVGTIGLDKNLLCGMYVSYSKRGQGIGNALLFFLEDFARKNCIEELILTASPNGYGFYLKNGFIPYGKIELQHEGQIFLETKMRKHLS